MTSDLRRLLRTVTRLRKRGDELTRSGRWHQEIRPLERWSDEAIKLLHASNILLKNTSAPPRVRDQLVREFARIEQLLEVTQVGSGFAGGRTALDRELVGLGLKHRDEATTEEAFCAIERELKAGPAAAWTDYTREAPEPLHVRLRKTIAREARRHRLLHGERTHRRSTIAGHLDYAELEVNHRAVERLSKRAEWRRLRRQDPKKILVTTPSVPVEDRDLVARCFELAQEPSERLYLEGIWAGMKKTEAQRAAGLSRPRARALERRIRKALGSEALP